MICAIVLWPIRNRLFIRGVSFQFDVSPTAPARVPPKDDQHTTILELDNPEVQRSAKNTEIRLKAPTLLNLPVMLLALPYAILNPAKTEWVPRGMDFEAWRAISWPFVGLIFWWIVGLGIEALLSARQGVIHPGIGWTQTAVGLVVLASGTLALIAFLGASGERDLSWAAAGAVWMVLGGATVGARVAQWRLRARIGAVNTTRELPS